MSPTFSKKKGSVESLKWRVRCGWTEQREVALPIVMLHYDVSLSIGRIDERDNRKENDDRCKKRLAVGFEALEVSNEYRRPATTTSARAGGTSRPRATALDSWVLIAIY